MSRFDSRDHLERWRTSGAFPAIHDAIFAQVSGAVGNSFLDIGCCYGLLCQRIQSARPAATVVGIDSNPKNIELGIRAGIRPTLVTLALTRETMPEVLKLIEQNRVTVIVARRCFPEIFGADLEAGQLFAEQVRAAGVTEIFLQGRVPVPKPSNSLYTVEREVEMLSKTFNPVRIHGQVAYMEAA